MENRLHLHRTLQRPPTCTLIGTAAMQGAAHQGVLPKGTTKDLEAAEFELSTLQLLETRWNSPVNLYYLDLSGLTATLNPFTFKLPKSKCFYP